MFKLLSFSYHNLRQYQSNHDIIIIARRLSQDCPRLETPKIDKFPAFLKNIESKWRIKLIRRADRERYVYSKEDDKLPRYILSMFPYPSGRLHLGHVRIYTSGDVLARYSKLMSKNEEWSNNCTHVINPLGFDSFGLPAENAAKERGLDPAKWTNSNIRVMKQQLDDLALQFDWREATSNPSFYKWTQELFLKLIDNNLVYKSYAQVNWDPVDKTVLADEQVDEEGRSWRSGALVEKRNLQQWFIKVNAFINDIYNADDVDADSWGDVLSIQRDWVGKPSGWLFYLPVSTNKSNSMEVIPVFTRMPELFIRQETRLLLSRDHWLETVYNISQRGFILNPLTGTNLNIEFTDDATMLPSNCKAVLITPDRPFETAELSSPDNPDRLQILLKAKLLGLGGYYTSDKYRDWLISRQRYWGTPIPVVNCDNCGYLGVARDSLPVKLPPVESLRNKLSEKLMNDDRITTPIAESAPKDWLETDCPSCQSKAKRECETFDTLFDSSWYFLRYATQPFADKPFDSERVQPVWCYIGGKEHASMHLFYARFITHFLHSQKLLKFKEPFKKLLVQGVVKGKTYRLDGRCIQAEEVDSLEDKTNLSVEYEKMSKSKGNGVDPQDLLDKYGIDATRLCLMSYANPKSERLWRSTREEFHDVLLFMRRVCLTVEEYVSLGLKLHQSTGVPVKLRELNGEELESKKCSLNELRNSCSISAIFNLEETNQFRQFIADLHNILSTLRSEMKSSVVYTEEFAENLATLIVMLNPLTPHLSEELWSHFSRSIINPLRANSKSRFKLDLQASDQIWPTPDNNYPRTVKVFALGKDQCLSRISLTKEELNALDQESISKLLGSNYGRVIKFQKYDDLVAIVTIRMDDATRNATKKQKKKKKLVKSSQQ